MASIAQARESAARDAVPDMVQISDYDEACDILRSDAFVQGAYPLSRETLMKDALTILDGEPHFRRRVLLGPLFNDKAVAAYRDLHLLPVVSHSLSEIAAMPRDADGIIHADLVMLVQRCLYRVAAAVAGLDGLEQAAKADRFIEQIRTITEGLVVEWSRDDPQAIIRRAQAALESFRHDFYNPSLTRRKHLLADAKAAGTDPKTVARDVLTTILLHQDEGWQGDDDLPMRETAVFVVAASQTTANSFITFIIHLENWLKNHPEDRKVMEDDPEFLRRCAFEALRMTVASPARIRTATRDVRLESGREIKAGQMLAMWFIPANQDVAHFGPDAETFNPRRKVDGASPWGLAFGSGVHMCPGRPLVTGSRGLTGKTDADGTLVSLARAFYKAGFELDPNEPPERDSTTHYPVFARVPARFKGL